MYLVTDVSSIRDSSKMKYYRYQLNINCIWFGYTFVSIFTCHYICISNSKYEVSVRAMYYPQHQRFKTIYIRCTWLNQAEVFILHWTLWGNTVYVSVHEKQNNSKMSTNKWSHY